MSVGLAFYRLGADAPVWGLGHHGEAVYRIRVENPKGVCRGVSRLSLDGTVLSGEVVLVDDGREHRVEVVLG